MFFASASSNFEESILHSLDKKINMTLKSPNWLKKEHSNSETFFSVSPLTPPFWVQTLSNMFQKTPSPLTPAKPQPVWQESYARILEERRQHPQNPPGDDALNKPTSSRPTKSSAKSSALDDLEVEVWGFVS